MRKRKMKMMTLLLGEPDNDGELEEADASAAACPVRPEVKQKLDDMRAEQEAAVQDLNQLPDELVEQFHATVISANDRQSGRQRKKPRGNRKLISINWYTTRDLF